MNIRNGKLLAGYAYGSDTDLVIQVSSEDEQTAFNIRFYPANKTLSSDIRINGEWSGRKTIASWA